MQTSVLEAHKVLAFNVPVAAEGLQRRSKLEKAMQEWFAEQGQRLKFVLWGAGGTGKSTLALKFAAGQAKDAVPRSPVRLVFALSRGSMVEGYAGLLDKLQGSSGGSAMAHEEARQRVHEVLQSPMWSGRWLGVLDDMPAPSELEEAGLGWVLKGFPWAHGRTIITTRYGEWVEDEEDAWEVTEAARRVCDKCGQSLRESQKCGQCRKVYYCSEVCQKQAWPEHKLVCEMRPAMRRSVATVMGLNVGSFGEEEACSWIKDKVKQWRNDEAGVVKLVQHLRCLPLAIGQVAAYARVHKTGTAAEYLAALKRQQPKGMAEKEVLKVGARVEVHSLQKAVQHNGEHGELVEYDREADRWAVKLDAGGKLSVRAANLMRLDKCPEGLGGVVMLSIGKIRESGDRYGKAARQAALKMALMAPEGIPLELLSSAERKGVPLLEQHGLVTVDGKKLGAMHALTQVVVREHLTDKEERPSITAAVAQALETKLSQFDYMKAATHCIGRRYASHASAAAGHAREWGLVPAQGEAERGRGGRAGGVDGRGAGLLESMHQTCSTAGIFLQYMCGQYGQAQGMYEMSLECAVARHGFVHATTAQSYGNLANVYCNLGKHEEAQVALSKSLEIILEVLGPEHPSVASSYSNLGNSYGIQGKYEEALTAHNKALEIGLKVLGPEHPEVAMSYNNLGCIYDKLGRQEEELMAHSKALEIQLKALGPEHPSVASSYNNLGGVYRNRGKDEEAHRLYSKALNIQLKVLGPQHPSVAKSCNNLGNVYASQGKHEEAAGAYSKALEIKLRVLGPDHRDVALSYGNLGNVYYAQGKYEDALHCHRQVLRIKRKAFGDIHPEVATTKANIGLILEKTVKAGEARSHNAGV